MKQQHYNLRFLMLYHWAKAGTTHHWPAWMFDRLRFKHGSRVDLKFVVSLGQVCTLTSSVLCQEETWDS